MPTTVLYLTFDCSDPARQAEFWATALSYEVDVRNHVFGEAEITDPKGVGLPILFLAVPEGKIAKNRMHIDLLAESPFEAEVERLVAAGASALDTHQDPEGYEGPHIWTVMQDPEGNEFCVGEPLSGRSFRSATRADGPSP